MSSEIRSDPLPPAAPSIAAPSIAAPSIAAPSIAAPSIASPSIAAPSIAAPLIDKHEADLKALFGDSEDELSDIDPLQVLSDEEGKPLAPTTPSSLIDIPVPIILPKFKRKLPTTSTPRKPPKERKREITFDEKLSTRALSPTSSRRAEVKRDIEAALSKINPRKSRKQDMPDEAEVDETMIRMVAKMKEAAESDHEFNKARLPATAKIILLPRVAEQLTKSQLAEQFLDNNLLEGVKAWLEPLPDASLPSLDIQKCMFKTLAGLPIRTQHLRESRLGRVVMFYSKCPRVLPEIQKVVRELLDRWMRPVLRRSDNYRDRVRLEKAYDPARRTSNDVEVEVIQPGDARAEAARHFVRIPVASAPKHDFIPVSVVATTPGSTTDARRPDRYKKFLKKT